MGNFSLVLSFWRGWGLIIRLTLAAKKKVSFCDREVDSLTGTRYYFSPLSDSGKIPLFCFIIIQANTNKLPKVKIPKAQFKELAEFLSLVSFSNLSWKACFCKEDNSW